MSGSAWLTEHNPSSEASLLTNPLSTQISERTSFMVYLSIIFHLFTLLILVGSFQIRLFALSCQALILLQHAWLWEVVMHEAVSGAPKHAQQPSKTEKASSFTSCYKHICLRNGQRVLVLGTDLLIL